MTQQQAEVRGYDTAVIADSTRDKLERTTTYNDLVAAKIDFVVVQNNYGYCIMRKLSDINKRARQQQFPG